MHTVCALCLWRPEEGIKATGTGVADGPELPCKCWDQNPSLLQEQWLLLTTELLFSPGKLLLKELNIGVVARLIACFPSMHDYLDLILSVLNKLGVGAHVSNTWKVEAGGSRMQGRSRLQSKCVANLDYTRSCSQFNKY